MFHCHFFKNGFGYFCSFTTFTFKIIYFFKTMRVLVVSAIVSDDQSSLEDMKWSNLIESVLRNSSKTFRMCLGNLYVCIKWFKFLE